MPILTLEYSLPEERQEADRAMRADDYYQMLFDLVTELRQRVKHGTIDRDVADFYDWLWRELSERGIDPLQ